jgi:hypothetical protein
MASNPNIDQIDWSSVAGFDEDARVWIFQSERLLTATEMEHINQYLSGFIPQWTSHNQSLKASHLLAFGRFVIIVLDQSNSYTASGCSIDALTQQIQGLGRHLNVNLQDRITCYLLDTEQEELISVPIHELKANITSGTVTPETLVLDPLVAQLKILRSDFLRPLGDGWHSRFL